MFMYTIRYVNAFGRLRRTVVVGNASDAQRFVACLRFDCGCTGIRVIDKRHCEHNADVSTDVSDVLPHSFMVERAQAYHTAH